MTEINKRHQVPYKSHPESNKLPAMIPHSYVEAGKFSQTISYDNLRAMWKTVRRLVDQISLKSPDLVIFFATGGIPYMIPTLQQLAANNKSFDAHMFPGLAWAGTVDGKKTVIRYFVEIAACLIEKTACKKPNPLVLLVDTTNTGNAVNKILKSIRSLMQLEHSPTFRAEVIGIVNGKANTSCHRKNTILVERCCRPPVGIVPPSGWQPSSVKIRNCQPIRFRRNRCDVTVEYWVVDNIPTEDHAALLGAKGLHDTLVVQAETSSGRIVVEYTSGGTKEISGGNAPGSTLMNILASDSQAAAWKALKTDPAMPTIGVDGGHLLELILSDEKSPGSVSKELMKNNWSLDPEKRGLLDPEEVYYLISRSETNKGTNIREMVLDSLRKHENKAAMCEACRSAIHARKSGLP